MKEIFDKINCLADLQGYISEINDGESALLEFKSVTEDLINNQKKANTKSLVAKELCAFLNSNDGIVCLGIENRGGILSIKNNSSILLEEFIDKNLPDMLEPVPSGIITKTIKEGKNNFLAIYIPKSDRAPHRVGSWKHINKDIVRNYYTRMGTNSIRMPEHLVRMMYLSDGRQINIDIEPKITEISNRHIKIEHFMKPDDYKFINEHMIDINIVLFDRSFHKIIFDETTDKHGKLSACNLYLNKQPIYPSYSTYPINEFTIKRKKEHQYKPDDALPETCSLTNFNIDDYVEMPDSFYDQIFAIYIETSFACDGFPLKTNKTLYITGYNRRSIDAIIPHFKSHSIFSVFEPTKVLAIDSMAENAFINDIDLSSVYYKGNQVTLRPIKFGLDSI